MLHTIVRKIEPVKSHNNKRTNTDIVGVDTDALYKEPGDNEVLMYKWYNNWYISSMDTAICNKDKPHEMHMKFFWVLDIKSLYITHMEVPDVSANKPMIYIIQQQIYMITKSQYRKYRKQTIIPRYKII